MGFLVSQHGRLGCDTPTPFSERFPLGEHSKWRCDTPPPPKNGISAILARYPVKNKANTLLRYPPLRYHLERVLRDMGGGVSRTGPLSVFSSKTKSSKNASKHPRNILSPVQLPENSPALFHSFAPANSNTSSNFSSHRESAGMATLRISKTGPLVEATLNAFRHSLCIAKRDQKVQTGQDSA